MAQNFCVIDIGTNAVKCKMFTNGEYYTPKNKFLSNQGDDNLDKDEVVSYIMDFMKQAREQNIKDESIYIAATEGFRTSSNQREIQEAILKKTGRKIHTISPKKEAWLSILGGLESIEFKGEPPKQVIFIESGGGSTEISLVKTESSPLKLSDLLATKSIPLGSKRYLIDKDKDKTNQKISEDVGDFLRQLRKKGIRLDRSVRIVINSSTASRILGRQYKAEKYNPLEIAQKQSRMVVSRFLSACQTVAEKKDAEELMKNYWLQEETVDGFIGHAYILGQILDALQKKSRARFTRKIPVTTTVGGLKDGLMDEIVQQQDKSPQEIEKKIFSVGEEDKDNKEDENHEKEKIDILKKRLNNTWMNEYESFYKEKNKDYSFHRDMETNKLTVSDGHNKITYTSSDRALVSADQDSFDNKIYEDMILLAKSQGMEDIKFEKDVEYDVKLRIYAACQKHGMKVQNFIYNPKMLENVSPQTQQIVKQAVKRQDSSLAQAGNKRYSDVYDL